MAAKKSTPGWRDVKARLTGLESADLLSLIQSLYAASMDNKVFLHTRFGLGGDPLASYKDAITEWINPPDFCHAISVSKAKKAISDYRKALGEPEGLTELKVFYCEEALDLLAACGMDDEGFYDALIRMFGQALKSVQALPAGQQARWLPRLKRILHRGQDVGWGVGEDFEAFWADSGFARED